MKYLVNRETKEHVLCDGPAVHHQSVYRGKHEWYVIEADPEGWIKHDGDFNPLPDDCRAEAKLINGETVTAKRAGSFIWTQDMPSTIVAYRPILDDKPVHVGVDMAADDRESHTADALQYFFAGIKRGNKPDLIDRLRTSHKAASELPDIIAELREVLEPMGYDLVARDPFVEPEPAEDMTDWRNWREGDRLEIIKTLSDDQHFGVCVGDIVKLLEAKSSVPYCELHDGSVRAFVRDVQLRFHSRPTKEQDK